ncbi:MAG: glycosyltransferase family 4 protein [Clostridia bacterium]|nr:glycosyltransferase family 4 protein [Clostridia bacterium]
MQKTVLFCITRSITGGAQKIVFSLIKGLYTKYNIILACAPGGELIEWVNSLGSKIKIYELPTFKRSINPAADLITLFRLIRIIKEEKVDIVHCHSSKAGLLGRLSARLCGVRKIIYTVHGWSYILCQNKFLQAVLVLIEIFAASLSSNIITVSSADEIIAYKWLKRYKAKISKICNGINLQIENSILRKSLNIEPNKTIIGITARLCEEKQPLYIIDIFSEILKKNKDLIFIWIGDGPLKERCLYEVKNLGIGAQFIFLGNREDVASLIGDFDAFVLLSKWEGLPLSVIEAMFAGLPIIANDVGGVSELVRDKVNGLLIKNNDKNDIIKRIEELVLNKALMKEYGLKSKELAMQYFTEDKMVKEYEKIYNE